MMRDKKKCFPRGKLLWVGTALFTMAIWLANICIGRYHVGLGEILPCMLERFLGLDFQNRPESLSVIMDVRFPRAGMGLLVGAALAGSGCAFQGLFRNPLVSQGVLGVSSGAAFGAALSIILFSGTIYTPVLSFGFGILAVVLSFLVARMNQGVSSMMLVLGGTIISNIFSALLSLIKYVADPANELASIVFWNMGSLASLQLDRVTLSVAAMAAGMVILFFCGWLINVLSMGENEAKSMGLPTGLAKVLVIVGATLSTAGAVSITGNIGWIGLIIPHIARFLVGSDNRKLIPYSMLLGGAFLMLIDLLCRTISGTEIPLGIMTSLIGGPFFIYLLKRYKGGRIE